MKNVRDQFPLLNEWISGKQVCYLDTAATALKPRCVEEAMAKFNLFEASNVHRGAHQLARRATERFEGARQTIASFLNASSPDEIVFTRNTTEGINLVAATLGDEKLEFGDEIWLTAMEHHSNIVPWQMAAERSGAKLVVIPVDDKGELDLAFIDKNLSERIKILAITHVSNALGTENPIAEVIKKVRAYEAFVLVDGAQAVTSTWVDVQGLDCDFYVFSAHKLFGPFGVGVLWGKKRWLESGPIYQGGGSMINEVSFEKTTFLASPHRYEAGTPNVSGVIGLQRAIEFFKDLRLEDVRAHEQKLLHEAEAGLRELGARIIGESSSRTNILSFVFDGIHAADIGEILDQSGVALRSGHHCCQPLMRRFSITGTVRASFSIYNTEEDVAQLVRGVKKAKEMLQ